MFICEACEKRRAWIKKWATIAQERARHLWSKDHEQSRASEPARLNKRPKRANASDKPTGTNDRQPDIG